MARRPRLHVPGGFYHVILRGNHREPLFACPADRVKLDALVASGLARFDARLHAYCWMTNHLHALIQVGDTALGRLVQSIATRYSRYRHEALQTSGHLFERRHFARLIDVDGYFLAVLRYIHLNPVKAGLVADPGEYVWSSHHAYVRPQSSSCVTTEVGLSLFASDPEQARRAYTRFVSGDAGQANVEIDERLEGSDPRILGGSEFVDRLQVAPRPKPSMTLDELAAKICQTHSVSVDALRSRTARHLTSVRLELLESAIESGIARQSEVARYLRRDPSTLSKQRTRRKS